MSIEQLRAVQNSRPFQRFTLILRDGARLAVEHQRAMSWSPSGNLVAVDVGGGFQFVAPADIADLQLRGGRVEA